MLSFWFPETHNVKLPDTVEEAERIGTKKKKEKKAPEQHGHVNTVFTVDHSGDVAANGHGNGYTLTVDVDDAPETTGVRL